MTRPACSLLLVHLLPGAMDIRAAERLVVARLTLGELPTNHARDQIATRLQAEYRLVQLERACGGPVDRRHVEFHGVILPWARPTAPARRERGTCPAAERLCAAAS